MLVLVRGGPPSNPVASLPSYHQLQPKLAWPNGSGQAKGKSPMRWPACEAWGRNRISRNQNAANGKGPARQNLMPRPPWQSNLKKCHVLGRGSSDSYQRAHRNASKPLERLHLNRNSNGLYIYLYMHVHKKRIKHELPNKLFHSHHSQSQPCRGRQTGRRMPIQCHLAQCIVMCGNVYTRTA
jgi:hypothetical protein